MFLFDPGYPIFRLFGTHFVFFLVLWDLKKTKCGNGGIGISTSNFYNLTNKAHGLFSSVFRFFISFIFFVYFALDKTGPNLQICIHR